MWYRKRIKWNFSQIGTKDEHNKDPSNPLDLDEEELERVRPSN